MKNLPKFRVEEIPKTRRTSSETELRQFVLEDRKAFKDLSAQWVRETGRLGLDEILAAGNPKFYHVEVNGHTGKSGSARTGFQPGNIGQAVTSLRVLFQGKTLQEVANSLRPILSRVIREFFPSSKLQRLARDWVWYIARDGLILGRDAQPEFLGASVTTAVGIYDVLWLVPEAPLPASYAWFSNYRARRSVGTYQRWQPGARDFRRIIRSPVRPGYMATVAKRMRTRRNLGVRVIATTVANGMGAEYSKSRHGMPALRISFNPALLRPIEN